MKILPPVRKNPETRLAWRRGNTRALIFDTCCLCSSKIAQPVAAQDRSEFRQRKRPGDPVDGTKDGNKKIERKIPINGLPRIVYNVVMCHSAKKINLRKSSQVIACRALTVVRPRAAKLAERVPVTMIIVSEDGIPGPDHVSRIAWLSFPWS